MKPWDGLKGLSFALPSIALVSAWHSRTRNGSLRIARLYCICAILILCTGKAIEPVGVPPALSSFHQMHCSRALSVGPSAIDTCRAPVSVPIVPTVSLSIASLSTPRIPLSNHPFAGTSTRIPFRNEISIGGLTSSRSLRDLRRGIDGEAVLDSIESEDTSRNDFVRIRALRRRTREHTCAR